MSQPSAEEGTGFRSGFTCFVGRPNAGKSTLMNTLVGTKVAITSTKPQTTRHAIRGIVHRADAQLIIVDTPGLHRPRTLLGERLNDVVHATWSEVDVVAFCVPANEKIGPGDRYIAEELAKVVHKTPVVGVVTKIDLVRPEQVAQQLVALQDVLEFAELIPVSARDGYQTDTLADLLVAALPEGPELYPDGELTDEPEQRLIAELIREAALEGVRDELPHSLAVTIEETIPREGRDDLVDIYAVLHVERPGQRGIVLGHRGERLREIGAAARAHIESLLGSKVYLDLHIKVASEWQRDPAKLRRLGF